VASIFQFFSWVMQRSTAARTPDRYWFASVWASGEIPPMRRNSPRHSSGSSAEPVAAAHRHR
jgi:hypothetical protein